MNKQEILAAYGTVPVKFRRYYKYVFTFGGLAEDGAQITICIGGMADDIYKQTIHNDEETTLAIEIDSAFIVQVKKDGEMLYDSYGG